MPRFSKISQERLNSCHPDIIRLFNEVIKITDFSVLSGHRTPAEQLELYKKGRTEPGKRVTNIDGYNIKSMHNFSPSLAVDVAPYPIDWNDIDRFKALSEIVKAKAQEMGIDI